MLCYSQSKYGVEHNLVSMQIQLWNIAMKAFLSLHTETYTERPDGDLEANGERWDDKLKGRTKTGAESAIICLSGTLT